MEFIDEAKIFLKGGDGGNGCVSFRREKFIPLGGPDGGDGGKGGDIIIVSNSQLKSLTNFSKKRHFMAQNGKKGAGKNKFGQSGKSLIIQVPVGTQILDIEKESLLFDFTRDNQEYQIITGGKGGLGNSHFKSSTNRSPRYRTEGEIAPEMWVWLSLKLISDSGLVGLPNAGKSTFLASVTSAKPKIASHMFSTLTPGLGVVYIGEERFILADIPGLLEGAHLGRGLGHRFLKHIERCKIILHLIDINGDDIVKDYYNTRNELASYSKKLAEKREIICLSKIDNLSNKEIEEKIFKFKKETNREVYPISSLTKSGVEDLLYKTIQEIKAYNEKE